MSDLNEEITLSNGRNITLARLLHEHALLVKFVASVARGASADTKPGQALPVGPYVNRRTFQRQTQQEAADLLRELGISVE